MRSTGRSLSELVSILRCFRNGDQWRLKDLSPGAIAEDHAVRSAVQQSEQELGDRGRVVLRASGTEPMVRVMVEADSQTVADQYADRLAAVVSSVRA